MARFSFLLAFVALGVFALVHADTSGKIKLPKPAVVDADKSDHIKPPKPSRCDLICKHHWRVDVCGESVDLKSGGPPFQIFRNYCALRKHNCRNPTNRYRAELDLVPCQQTTIKK